MKIFIWDYIEKLTDSYHYGGGLAVIASDIDHAIDIAKNQGVQFMKEGEKFQSKGIETWNEKDDFTSYKEYELMGNPEPKVFSFPDQGCCG